MTHTYAARNIAVGDDNADTKHSKSNVRSSGLDIEDECGMNQI